ncbi:MAG: hypothetical protein FWF08_09025 [Oscillospiraceae bacterium]|nr:hypothetical protein [Oscillospiraceae bacterium]
MWGRRGGNNGRGLFFCAFGAGMFAAVCLPSSYLIVIMAAAFIFCGVSLYRK